MGDAVALGACQTYEKGLGAHALTVVAGFSTTVGAAYRYQNQVSEATGGGMPPPADVQGPNYTSTAPTVLCVADGTIDVICSDHTPVDDDAKQLPFAESEPGATGLELLLPLTLKWAGEAKVALPIALSRITADPARVLGIDAGHLAIGAAADVCIFDPDLWWTVDRHSLRSQGKNTPFLGLELAGKVRFTLVSGHVVHES